MEGSLSDPQPQGDAKCYSSHSSPGTVFSWPVVLCPISQSFVLQNTGGFFSQTQADLQQFSGVLASSSQELCPQILAVTSLFSVQRSHWTLFRVSFSVLPSGNGGHFTRNVFPFPNLLPSPFLLSPETSQISMMNIAKCLFL